MTKSIKIIHGLVILAILGFVFYWFELRPANIRKDCITYAQRVATSVLESEEQVESRGVIITKKADYQSILDERYNDCLIDSGLEK